MLCIHLPLQHRLSTTASLPLHLYTFSPTYFAQLGVLLDVLDEVDERVLVELPVAKVRLALQHPFG